MSRFGRAIELFEIWFDRAAIILCSLCFLGTLLGIVHFWNLDADEARRINHRSISGAEVSAVLAIVLMMGGLLAHAVTRDRQKKPTTFWRSPGSYFRTYYLGCLLMFIVTLAPVIKYWQLGERLYASILLIYPIAVVALATAIALIQFFVTRFGRARRSIKTD